MISVSIVSHGQTPLVAMLLDDIKLHCNTSSLEILLTLNLPNENTDFLINYNFPIKVIENSIPLGFGENHNNAFSMANGKYFCVLNPDIRFFYNPFPELTNCLMDKTVGISAPMVFNQNGEIDDSARDFPTPLEIILKYFGFNKTKRYNSRESMYYPDWVAGMFMLFKSETYKEINGFDDKYFLYYEDVDICARLTIKGKRIVLCTTSRVIHYAQRSSHKNLKYLRWHISSMLRFFFSINYLRLLCR